MKVDADIRALEDDQLEAWISIARLSLAMGVPEMAGDARRALERRLAMMEAEGAERVERARAWEARARARADQGMWA